MEYFFQNIWPLYLIPFVLLLIGFEIFYRRKRLLVYLPRVLWIAGVIIILLDFYFSSSVEMSAYRPSYFIFDRSASVLEIPERREKVELFLQEIQSWSENNSQPVQIYSLGDHLQKESFDLPETSYQSLASPLEELREEQDVLKFLISDGNFQDRFVEQGDFDFIAIGPNEERDIWIDRLSEAYTAFLKNRFEINFEIKHQGFEGQEIEVHLLAGEEILDTRNLSLGETASPVQFDYFPEKMGEEVLAIRVEEQSGELSSLNNVQSFRLRTVRDKMRILHIGGKPNQDLKAWRLFLTRQPDVDLVSFYILRSLEDDPQARNNELSLIPFPYDELFTTELPQFDVVILQNFDFSLYFQSFYLENLVRFVRNGGALLIFGGDQSLHRYALSPLSRILPFVASPGDFLERFDSRAQASYEHPLTQEMDWAFEDLQWKLRHPVERHPQAKDLVVFEDNTPLLSIREVDEGRVLAMNTSESWRMHFQPYGDYIPFGRFARRVLQYLTFDPEMDEKRLQAGDWIVGEKVKLKTSNAEKQNWRIRSLYWNKKEWEFEDRASLEFEVPFPGVFEVQVDNLPQVYRFETQPQAWRNEWKDLLQKQIVKDPSRFLSFENRRESFRQSSESREILSVDAEPWMRASNTLSFFILVSSILMMCFDFFLRKRLRLDA